MSETGRANDGERLQKVLARIGLGSRRANEILIEAGKVKVNGERAVLGCRVNPDIDEISVEGTILSIKTDLITYLLNKPPKHITTTRDPQGRKTVMDLVPSEPRVFPVGRLDYDTEGLLLLTNDGDLAHRLTHPSFGIEKEYLADLDSPPSRRALRQLRDGVQLEDGPAAPAKASAVGDTGIKLTIHEGRNRQVRRMCAAVGYEVKRLARTRIGPLRDPGLKPGEWRQLDKNELLELQRAVGLKKEP